MPKIRFVVGYDIPRNREIAEALSTIEGATSVEVLVNNQFQVTVNGKKIDLARYEELHTLRYINRKLREKVKKLENA